MRRLIFGLVLLFAGCSPIAQQPKQITHAFYYWRSTFHLSEPERHALAELNISQLYVKFFDVAWDASRNAAHPVAILQIDSSDVPQHTQIIPVVFLTEESLARTEPSAIPKLSQNIAYLIHQLSDKAGITTKEVQLDCDWTDRTREKYFDLLTRLRSALPSSTSLSATIRLHQIKYREKTGVPPVDRGMLMLYNMSNWRDINTRNSIFDKAEAEKYTRFVPDYPLNLDLVIPLFHWTIAYRNDRFLTILNNVDEASLAHLPVLNRSSDHLYTVRRDTTISGAQLRQADKLRAEAPDMNDVRAVTRDVIRGIRSTEFRVALYHLDSTVLSSYSHDLSFDSLRDLFVSSP